MITEYSKQYEDCQVVTSTEVLYRFQGPIYFLLVYLTAFFHSGSLTKTSTAQSKDIIANRCPRDFI